MLAAVSVFGILNFAIRPAEKIAALQSDVHQYSVLLSKSDGLDASAIRHLLHEARETDTDEIEPLRVVAFNDVMLEIDELDARIPLTPMQKLIDVLA